MREHRGCWSINKSENIHISHWSRGQTPTNIPKYSLWHKLTRRSAAPPGRWPSWQLVSESKYFEMFVSVRPLLQTEKWIFSDLFTHAPATKALHINEMEMYTLLSPASKLYLYFGPPSKGSNFQTFQTFKLSNFQTFNLLGLRIVQSFNFYACSNFQTFKVWKRCDFQFKESLKDWRFEVWV